MLMADLSDFWIGVGVFMFIGSIIIYLIGSWHTGRCDVTEQQFRDMFEPNHRNVSERPLPGERVAPDEYLRWRSKT